MTADEFVEFSRKMCELGCSQWSAAEGWSAMAPPRPRAMPEATAKTVTSRPPTKEALERAAEEAELRRRARELKSI